MPFFCSLNYFPFINIQFCDYKKINLVEFFFEFLWKIVIASFSRQFSNWEGFLDTYFNDSFCNPLIYCLIDWAIKWEILRAFDGWTFGILIDFKCVDFWGKAKRENWNFLIDLRWKRWFQSVSKNYFSWIFFAKNWLKQVLTIIICRIRTRNNFSLLAASNALFSSWLEKSFWWRIFFQQLI